jgi:hypothetical protein
MVQIAFAEDVNITLNIISPPPFIVRYFGSLYTMIIAVGSFLFLCKTFLEFSTPEEKVEAMLIGVIVLAVSIAFILGVII